MKGFKDYIKEISYSVVNKSNFKKWFGKSKVVDKSGNPLVVYHGSNKDFDTFDKSTIGSSTDIGIWGKGFYFSDYKTAKRYGSLIKELFLSIQNPYVISEGKQTIKDVADYLNMDESTLHEVRGFVRPYTNFVPLFTSNVKEKGHDGVIVDRKGISNEFVVFKPNQIKSATDNNGNFNPKSNDITE
jgi:hypothetical protein